MSAYIGNSCVSDYYDAMRLVLYEFLDGNLSEVYIVSTTQMTWVQSKVLALDKLKHVDQVHM